MTKIFISYRREDTQAIAGRICDRFLSRYGADAIFFDIDSIPLGVDFRDHIRAAIDQSCVLLVLMGERWSSVSPDGIRRLDDPDDLVRVELEFALDRRIPVIPVLIDRAVMPTTDELPGSLAELPYRHAVRVDTGIDFQSHLGRLMEGVEAHFGVPPGTGLAEPEMEHNSAAVRLDPTLRLLQDIRMKDCLRVLGVSPQHLDAASRLVSELVTRSSAARTDKAPPKTLRDYLAEREETHSVVTAAHQFSDELLCCTDLSWLLGQSFYLSTQKVVQLYRAHRSAIADEVSNLDTADLDTEDKLLLLHQYFIRAGQLVFLPSRLLLRQPLSASASDCLCYFLGRFELVCGDAFHATFPQARGLIESGDRSYLYGLVTEMFQNPDPMVLQLIEFNGRLGDDVVSMTLSRKYFSIGSSTATDLCEALTGEPVVLSGLARMHRRAGGAHELQALVCRFSGPELLLKTEGVLR